MTSSFPHCPGPPDWKLDWDFLDQHYPWIRAMAGCTQDTIHHAEGDVWIHVRMVCEALTELPAWRALPDAEREMLFAAALLHDVAKPECRREEGTGHISFRGHSRRGAILARQILWRLKRPFAWREQVCALVRHHQIPFYFIDRDDAQKLALEISQKVRCDYLALLAEADARGRQCHDKQKLLDNIALFAESCRELGCLDRPYAFPSEHTRFVYFREQGRHPDVPVHEDFRCEVILMSGLPGSGKSHWIEQNAGDWPLVSLDALREEMDIDPADTQGEVINEARHRAREYLRQGTSFLWNATNLSKQIRQTCINLFADYHARIRIVYVETSEEKLLQQNRSRSKVVPAAVITRCLDRWEVPDATEAHQVEDLIDARAG